MIWFNPWGTFEKIFLASFALLYLVYLIRVWMLSKKYKLDFTNVLKKIFLRTLYFSLIIVGILGPSFGDAQKEIAIEGKDIYFMVDVSLSMAAEDVAPSRMALAKACLLAINQKISANDRVTMLLFASNTIVACPLTYDHAAMEVFIASLGSCILENGGSDIDQALAFLKSEMKVVKTSKNQKKIVLLISDGEFENAPNADILQQVKKDFIIHTLSVGSIKGGRIPVTGGFKRDKKGIWVTTKTNTVNMEILANSTGGKSTLLVEPSIAAHNFFRETQKIEQQFKGYKQREVSANKYEYFLLLALLLIIVDGLSTLKIIYI